MNIIRRIINYVLSAISMTKTSYRIHRYGYAGFTGKYRYTNGTHIYYGWDELVAFTSHIPVNILKHVPDATSRLVLDESSPTGYRREIVFTQKAMSEMTNDDIAILTLYHETFMKRLEDNLIKTKAVDADTMSTLAKNSINETIDVVGLSAYLQTVSKAVDGYLSQKSLFILDKQFLLSLVDNVKRIRDNGKAI